MRIQTFNLMLTIIDKYIRLADNKNNITKITNKYKIIGYN